MKGDPLNNNLRKGTDGFMESDGKPVCTLDEIQGYVWEKTPDGKADKEHPKKENDHAVDELRYFARYVLTNDHTEKPLPQKFAPGSFGDVLDHQKKARKRRRR